MEHKCQECGKEFSDEQSLKQHKLDRHESIKQAEEQKKHTEVLAESRKIEEQKLTSRTQLFGQAKKYGIIALVIVILAAGFYAYTNRVQDVKAANEDAGIPTGPIHWHPHLRIEINGEDIFIPTDIGITQTVHYPIHTHDATGTIHMEIDAPTSENIRLAYFFKVWGKTFNESCIFEYCNGENGTVKMLVNGKPNTEYGNYIMHDGDKIEIIYSNP